MRNHFNVVGVLLHYVATSLSFVIKYCLLFLLLFNSPLVVGQPAPFSLVDEPVLSFPPAEHLLGHNTVTNIAYSPDGQYLVSSGHYSDGVYNTTFGELIIWELATGQVLHTILGHNGAIVDVIYSPDGRFIASVGSDKTVKIVNAAAGELVQHFELASSSSDIELAFSPDGQFLLIGMRSQQSLQLWDVNTGQHMRDFTGHEGNGYVWSVAFAPSGQQVVSGGEDDTVKIWDVNSGETLHTLVGHVSNISAVTYSPDGQFIIAGGSGKDYYDSYDSQDSDNSIKVWDAITGELVRTLDEQHTQGIMALAYSPDGNQLLSGDGERVNIWNVTTWDVVQTLTRHNMVFYNPSYGADGKTIAFMSGDNSIRLWDVETNSLLRTLNDNHNIKTMALSPDGTRLLSVGYYDRIIKLWDATAQTSTPAIFEFTGIDSIHKAFFTPDGQSIISVDTDDHIRLWNVNTGESVRSFAVDSTVSMSHSTLSTNALAPDGGSIATYSHAEQTIKIWDVTTGNVIQTLSGLSRYPTDMTYSPDGQFIAAGQECLTSFDYYLLTFSECQIKVWDINTGVNVLTLDDDESHINALAYSPDGQFLAFGNDDGELSIWDLGNNSTRLLNNSLAYNGSNHLLSYSPDGRFLAARQENGSIKDTVTVWQVDSGNVLTTFTPHATTVTAVVWALDGHSLYTSSLGRTIKKWDMGDIINADSSPTTPTPLPALPPRFTASATAGSAPLTVTFDASANNVSSTAAQSWSSTQLYVTDAKPQLGTGSTFTITYDKPGTYAVMYLNNQASAIKLIEVTAPLTDDYATPQTTTPSNPVDDTYGTPQTGDQPTTVPVNFAPLAKAQFSALEGVVPFTITLDASESIDPEEHGLRYIWQSGDGQISGQEQVSFTYEKTGQYDISLTVFDSANLSDQISQRINVTNNAPLAVLKASALQGNAPLTVTFDGHDSADPDNHDISYEWRVNGQQMGANRHMLTTTFDDVGTYQVHLIVIDAFGEVSEPEVVDIIVTDNAAPIAQFSVTPDVGGAPLLVTLDASASSGTSAIQTYTWETTAGQRYSGQDDAQQVEVTFDQLGTYDITLTVTDDDGNTDSLTKTVNVVSDSCATQCQVGQPCVCFDLLNNMQSNQDHYFNVGERLTINLNVHPNQNLRRVEMADLYVAIVFPDGQMWFIDELGHLTADPEPYHAEMHINDDTYTVLDLGVPPCYGGVYVLYSALVAAGEHPLDMQFASNLAADFVELEAACQ